VPIIIGNETGLLRCVIFIVETDSKQNKTKQNNKQVLCLLIVIISLEEQVSHMYDTSQSMIRSNEKNV
jgi:hypothetical protein